MTQAVPLKAMLAALVVVAAICDAQTRRVPNVLTVGGVAAGLAMNVWLSGWPGAKSSLLGLAVGFAIFLPLFLLRGMGGGDVKLMSAIGAMVGPYQTVLIFVLTAVAGGVMAVALVLAKGVLGPTLRNMGRILGNLARGKAPHSEHPELSIDHEKSIKLPYAIPIAVGSLLSLLL